MGSWQREDSSQGQVAYTWRDPRHKIFKDERGGETEGYYLNGRQSHGQRTTEKETLGPQ